MSRRIKPRPRRLALVLVLTVVGLGSGPIAHAGPTVPVPEISAGMTGGDYVHISSTPPRSASAHGWWTYPTKTELIADVEVRLKVQRGGTWVDVGVAGVERVRPGGGSANRSNARVPCATTAESEWRSIVDVDVVGRPDSPGKLYTPARRLRCGV